MHVLFGTAGPAATQREALPDIQKDSTPGMQKKMSFLTRFQMRKLIRRHILLRSTFSPCGVLSAPDTRRIYLWKTTDTSSSKLKAQIREGAYERFTGSHEDNQGHDETIGRA
jgi:hypothetical protein